jgi:hypothetical protein
VIEPLSVDVIRSCRLVAHGRGDTAEQGRHFGTGLREAENVVDEEEHVLALNVAEIFGLCETGERDTCAGARWLVHLPVHERALGPNRRSRLRVDVDLGVDHLVIEVVAFASALTDAGQHGIAAIGLGDVVDQFLHRHGLADAGAAEQADLAAFGVGAEQVDDLDACDQHFRGAGLLGKCRRIAVDARHVFV